MTVKPSLSPEQQVELLRKRGLDVADVHGCIHFLTAQNYYRFSGYLRYFQVAPHDGDNAFHRGASFESIRSIYDADALLREVLTAHLARAELLLRTHTARAIAETSGAYGAYLESGFYTDAATAEPTVESCLRDIERSRERHILRYAAPAGASGASRFEELPVWSAVEAWSFGTLSKCIERGAAGSLSDAVAGSLGVARSGFAHRVRALVYLRNRCAHHSRIWNHSLVDAGPTPNNVRAKAKRLAGQFDARSALDAIASLDDILVRGTGEAPILPGLVARHSSDATFWRGLSEPKNPRDHRPDVPSTAS